MAETRLTGGFCSSSAASPPPAPPPGEGGPRAAAALSSGALAKATPAFSVRCPPTLPPLTAGRPPLPGLWQGADLAGLMRSAASFALERCAPRRRRRCTAAVYGRGAVPSFGRYAEEALLRGWRPGEARGAAPVAAGDGDAALLEVSCAHAL